MAVTAQGWAEPDPQLRAAVVARVAELLDELPLQRRPRVVGARPGPEGPAMTTRSS